MIDYDRWIHYSTYCIEPWLGLLTVRSMYLCRKHLNNTFLRPFMEQRCYYNPKIPKGSGNPPRLVLYLVNFGDCRFRWNRLSIEMASPGGRQQGNVQIRKYHVERILASLDRQQAYIQIRFGSQPLTPAVEQNSLYSLYYARYFSPCAQGDYPNYLGGHSSQPLLIYLPSKMCCVLSESYPPIYFKDCLPCRVHHQTGYSRCSPSSGSFSAASLSHGTWQVIDRL